MTSLSGADEGFMFAAGNHGFQFDYTLPSDLPSTFEGRWGKVKYSVKATLVRPCRFDIERDAELTISALVDLNDDQELAVSSCCNRNTLQHVTCLINIYVVFIFYSSRATFLT